MAAFGITLAAALAAPFLLPLPAGAIVGGTGLLIALLSGIGLRRTGAGNHGIASTQTAPKPADETERELASLRTMQHDLIAAKQAAEAATMAKGEFLATMSHEIRTPLNGIIPLLDLLLSTPLQADQREYLATARESAGELLRIVDDILDYSKLEASKLELESVGLNLKELVDSVAMLMEGSATAKGLRLSVAIDPSVRLAVRGDPVRLRQVLTNLVSNAIKFTERGSVTIQVGKRGESRSHYETVFGVRDTGIGLDEKAAARLFAPFSQADASTTRLYGGTGLGLTICKRLVDLMGGKIGVRSEPGRGSLFWFNVPLLKAVGDIRVRRDLNGVRALVVSPDEGFVRRCSGLLGNLGVSVTPITLAAEALNRLRAGSNNERWGYELVVLDAETIRQAAVAFARNVLRDPALNHVRMLACGSDEAIEDLRGPARTGTLGARFDERELRSVLYQLLGIDDAPAEREAPLFDLPATVAAPTAAGPPRLRGRVLLVEDNPVNLQVARRLLSLAGLEIDTAGNGRVALDCLADAHYDLVLMDCQMPVMDGYTATRQRREAEAANGLPRLPIIAMTANAMAGDREKCLAAGMDEYLSKPLDRSLLESTLARWLADAPGPAAATTPVAATTASASPAQDAATALDEAVIRELVDVMGNEFGDLVRVYLEDAPRLIGALRGAALRGDVDTFGVTAHSLKSSSANLGARMLAELARQAEQATREGREIDLDASAQAIEDAFGRAREAFRALGF
ncbi:MAG: response regulator [Dokdonella sp.]|nr:response regulator [Dokdonella sp.]